VPVWSRGLHRLPLEKPQAWYAPLPLPPPLPPPLLPPLPGPTGASRHRRDVTVTVTLRRAGRSGPCQRGGGARPGRQLLARDTHGVPSGEAL